jgi:hypothetical protein
VTAILEVKAPKSGKAFEHLDIAIQDIGADCRCAGQPQNLQRRQVPEWDEALYCWDF